MRAMSREWAIFLIWIIGGAVSTSNSGTQAHNQAVSYCRTNWQGLYSSYADCVTSYGNTLNAASDTGGISSSVLSDRLREQSEGRRRRTRHGWLCTHPAQSGCAHTESAGTDARTFSSSWETTLLALRR
jgi:hypothetical protein